MVNDNGRQPQRRSTRPAANASGTQPTRRSTRPASVQPRSGTTRTSPRNSTGNIRTGATRGGNGGKGGKGGGGGRVGRNGEPIPTWKFWLRRIGVGALAAGLATALIGFIVLFARYQSLNVPEASEVALQQASTVYYADGTTVMGRLGEADRTIIDIDSLPSHVYNAFVAAEDRSFYTNPGVDAAGTVRALFKTVVLGQKQGGSTITQQYVERYYVGATTTDMKGKIDEALLALKIDTQQEKKEILGNYINTVYFGRGAYGIEAAARKYYGKHAAELTASESAMLAGLLPAPSRWDPRLDPEQAEYRWNYVLDGMVELGEITQAQRDLMTFPDTIEYANNDVFGGPKGHLLRAALDEVEDRTGITQEEVETRGLSIVTTFNQATQQAIEVAVAQMPEDAAPNLRVAAITMDPQTGAVTGMYGGADYLEIQRNAATQDIAQAGSTFKPFTLVAALEDGIALDSVYNGANRKSVPGFDSPVRNFAGASYGDIDLVEATAFSVNTVYTQLNMDVGPQKTREVAVRAGMPEDTTGLEDNPSNVLGTASPHAIDLASAYSTYAAGGVRTEPYMVSQVILPGGELYYEHQPLQERVFDPAVMADATYAMQQVVNYRGGSGQFAAELGRPIAGKTGTSNDNRSAWFVGFTPQQVGVVGMYQVGPNGEAEEITPLGGFSQITGGSMPVRIWTWMMGPILQDAPVVEFPPRANVGEANTPSPSPSPTPTPSPSPSPSPTPTPTPDPAPSPPPPPPTEGPLPTAGPVANGVAKGLGNGG